MEYVKGKAFKGIPKLDFSGFAKPMTEEELRAGAAEYDARPKMNWREFVDRVEAHPGCLSSWDMDIPFDEFARRVRAGEFD